MNRLWSAVLLATMLGVSQGIAEEYDEVHPCDEYAAHPDDPNRWAKGVADKEIIPGPAVKFCRQAVDDHGDTPRFRFQLGRALWAANRLEEGLAVFAELEQDAQYGPAYAYLADAYMYGIGGVEVDQELAVSLYQVAKEDGFSPAGEILAAVAGMEIAGQQPAPIQESTLRSQQPDEPVVPQDFQRQESTQERSFSPDAYLESAIMSGLYHGNMSAVRTGTTKYIDIDKTFFYINGFLKPLQENYNFRDASCVYLANPTLVRIVNTKVLRGMPGAGGMFAGNGMNLEQNLNAGAEMGWKMMGDILQGINSGQGILGSDYGQMGVETTLLDQHGEKDSTRLIDQHGCSSDVVKRIYANLVHFVTGEGEPQVSAEEKQRQSSARAAEAKRVEEERQKELRVSASKSCVSKFKKQSYCGCLVDSLDEQGITDDEWKKLGNSFSEVITVGRRYDGFSEKIRACRVEKG